jgi:hypothetical protein
MSMEAAAVLAACVTLVVSLSLLIAEVTSRE